MAAIDQSINKELELLERIRKLEEIEQALRRQLEIAPTLPAMRPVEPPAVALAPQPAPAADIPEGRPTAPAPQNEQDAGWMLMLGLMALLSAALILHERRRKTPSGPMARKGLATPAQKPAGTVLPESEAPAIPVIPRTTPATATRADASRSAPGSTSQESAGGKPIRTLDTDAALPFSAMDDDQTVAPLIVNEDVVMEHESALELADIMVSFGRVHGAAETLADFIRANPRQSVMPWLKLMEVYRLANMKPEFDALARQLNKTFNVATVTWDNFEDALKSSDGVEILAHVMRKLTDTWATRECQIYVYGLLRDNRDGTRQGLPLAVLDDILMLNSVLEEQLGRYRPEANEKAA